MTGLQFTLLQYKPLIKKWDEGLQIIHCHGCHWVVEHKEAVCTDIVKVYDTLYDDADDVIKTVLPCKSKQQAPIIVVFSQ